MAPLPAWCVDILLSPDLLPQLFSSFGLSEHAAVGVCSTWSRAYSRQLRRRRYIDPTRVRRLTDVPEQPGGLCMLPGGVLAITACENVAHDAVNFVAARADSDPQALAAYRASSLAARRFRCLVGLARTDDGLLACNLDDSSAALYKFALDGSMDELATVPPLAEYRGGFSQCAVHQQTQRTYALAMGRGTRRDALVLLDSNLRVVATVDAADSDQAIWGVAVHGDQVIVLTGTGHPKGSGGCNCSTSMADSCARSPPGGFVTPKVSQLRTGGSLWSTKTKWTTMATTSPRCSTSSTSSPATPCKL